MKKIISLILTVCMLFTMVYAASVTATAETTVNETNSATFDEIAVDLSKLYRIGTDNTSIENLADGGVKVIVNNYGTQLFNSDGSFSTSALWISTGSIFALKDDNDNFIVLQGGKEYAINIVYEVESIGTENAFYHPQIALVRNNHASNVTQDNGTVIYTAKKHASTGTYSLSYSAAPSGNQPLRLAFSGHGTINIKSITIKQVTKNFGTTGNIDLTNVEPISVSSPSYSNFTPATADAPLSLDVNATYAYSGTLFDGTNSWINSWTVMYLKSMIPLKYDADNYVVLDNTKTYSISVKYKVTATTAEAVTDYPEIGIVYNNGYDITHDNGSKVVAAQRIAPTEVGVEKTLNTTVNGMGLDGHALRLAFTGKGSFEVSSVTISECKNAFAITFNNDGMSTVDYILAGEALPTPVKDGAVFKGWFDADGVKYTAATKPVTLNAVWVKTNNVDLTKSVKIAGSKGSITLNVPTENCRPLNVKTQGFNNILLDKESETILTTNVWTAGAAVNLKFADDTYANLKSTSKYVVNVNYDVTYVNTATQAYLPQIAIIYNNNPSASNVEQDNGTVIMDVKKHGVAVDNATISCVISGVDANAIRLAFDGHGEFNVNSVTITEITAENDALVMVNLTDSVYSRDEIIVAEKGATIADLQRTLLHNFGGWYSDDVKVTTVDADVTLTAKWFGKADVNMDGIVNIDDLTVIKEAIADAKTDAVYDVDRNSAVNDADVNLIRKNILGIQSVTIAGNNIRAYKLEKGALPFFMTTQATDLLVTSFKEFCGVDIQNTAKATNKIVVSIPNIAQDELDNSALNTLTGVKGDVYGVDDYKIFLYNNDLYIEGGSDYATAFAVNEFISFIQKYEMIPVGFELSGKYNGERGLGEGYSYVWGDEFNGGFLDTTKWLVETGTSSGPCYALNDPYYLSTKTNGNWTYNSDYNMMQDGEVRYLDEEGNNYYLEDGLLVMNTKKTDYGYSATKISAKNKYNFTYGIMTARVKLATKNGASSTFWARSLDDLDGIKGGSVNEMDFVENYGAEQIRANLHTWTEYVNDTNHSGEIDYQETIYPAEGESLSDAFHEITLYWTADKIVFYFDGVKYLEQDIGSDPEKWEAFYKSTYLIMGVSAPTGIYGTYNNGTTPGEVLGTLVDSFNENLCMDYIRVYRK